MLFGGGAQANTQPARPSARVNQNNQRRTFAR
jgi:hypothetical protein